MANPKQNPFSQLPSWPIMERFLDRALPGASECTRRLRTEILHFAASPSSKSVLLTGPIGAGKSTLARLIGMLKRVAHLDADTAQKMLDDVPFDRANQIDTRYMSSWYVELPLTGLVENLADAQLFGSVKGAYTDAIDKAGIFELASTGRISKKDIPPAAQATGGIVFLDEIGDLSEKLQAKLLPVLSGGSFYRVGTEGKHDADLQFRGVTITASWRPVDKCLRPDLLSRIANCVIDVPGIDDRVEDFDALLTGVQDCVISSLKRDIERVMLESSSARSYWTHRLSNLDPLSPKNRRLLGQVRWTEHGNLRGLTAAVEQLLTSNRDPDDVVRSLKCISETRDVDATETGTLFARLMKRSTTKEGLAAHLRTVELETRRALREDLFREPRKLAQLAGVLGLDETKLRNQLRQLDRERKTKSRENVQ